MTSIKTTSTFNGRQRRDGLHSASVAGVAPARTMSGAQPIHGDLQAQVMAVMWRLEAATVEQVRAALPPRHRGAYTTIQTVLNRLAERGLLTRHKARNVIEYRPAIAEADHVAQSIARRLEAASSNARQVALARLLGELSDAEVSALRRLAGGAPDE